MILNDVELEPLCTRKDTNPDYKLTDMDMTIATRRCKRPLGVNIDKMREEYLLFQDQDS